MNYQNVINYLVAHDTMGMNYGNEEERIKELCSYATVKCMAKDRLVTVSDYEITIEDGLGELPEDCFMVQSAFLSKRELGFEQESTFIKPYGLQDGTCLINYKAIPYDENGLPVVDDRQLEYLAQYIKCVFYEPLAITGKISQSMYDKWEQKRDALWRHAVAPRLTNQKLDRVVWMMKYGQFYNINPRR
jgi:hypothetical protein